ncbi:MAG TPA: M20/M25/M40 family metallo-hydrolase, partial [Gemmatimonadales bacterium]|nr:M20/M25/M40 family metallo-hydrolase [Gemmatimonadales bacterium]
VASRLDGARMLGDVALLSHDSMEGRGAGTAGGARARRWLLAEYGRIGLEPGAGFEQRFALDGGDDGVNLVGTIPGRTRPDRVLVLGAHYDHLGTRRGAVYNGADDDASGVAAVLELARRFRAHPPASTVVVVLFDAEERGTEGSAALVRAPPVPLDRVAAVVNLDMVGRNAAGELWIAGPAHWPKLGPVAEVAAARSRLRVRLGHDGPGRDDWTFASDHGPFHAAGVPFLYFGEEDHPDYHRPTDDVERIQPEFLHKAAETVLDALLVLDTLTAPTR